MRLLFLAGRDIKHPHLGGGDLLDWESARYLSGRGHQVTYIAGNHPSLPSEEEVSGIRILRLGNSVLLPLRALAFYRRHRHEIDLVIEDVIGGSRLPFLSPLYATKPVVAIWHQVTRELFLDSYPTPVAVALGAAEKLLATCYREVWLRVPSEESRIQLHRELSLPLERMTVIPPGVPEDWLNQDPVARGNEPIVACISNFRRYKGIHALISAFPIVLKEQHSARLIIAGRIIDTAYEGYLRGLIARLRLSDFVALRTNITDDEKRTLLLRSRLLVVPSRREGFSIVVLEANACGVPVVASSGVPQSAVQDGRNGLRYRRGDGAALAESIIRILSDDELHNHLSENGVAFAKRFGWANVGAQFEDLVISAIRQGAKQK